MPHPEHSSGLSPEGQTDLPAPLAEFLRAQEPYVALFHDTDRGTALIAKLPGFEIDSLRGPVPMHLQHLIYDHPAAPVLRSVLTILDTPVNPLGLEAFTNVADQEQRETLAALGWQSELLLHFYDDQLQRQLTKRVSGFPQPEVLDLIDYAVNLLRRVPRGQFDFDRAKEAVIRTTTL